LLGLLLLTFPTHEVALHVCDNSLAPSLADLGNTLGVYVKATIAQPNRVGMGNNSASINRHDRVAVLVDVTVNPNELADGKFWFERLLHCFSFAFAAFLAASALYSSSRQLLHRAVLFVSIQPPQMMHMQSVLMQAILASFRNGSTTKSRKF
jgi:hypothetical protein